MVLALVVTNNKIDDANEATAKAQAEQQAAQAKIGQLQAFGDFAALKVSREQAVKSVAEQRFDYERLMREVALVLPHNTYLTNLTSGTSGAAAPTTTTATATSTGPSITVAGCAPSHPSVATAVVRLRKLHNVQDVDLKSSQKAGSTSSTATSGASVCPVTWNATLTFAPESTSTATGPVPARLGGGQ